MSRHIPRFLVSTPLSAGQSVQLDAGASHHLLKVLRRTVGDAAVLFDGSGGEWTATLVEAGRGTAVLQTDAHQQISRESPLEITLAQCISRGERMDYCMQKATELGVTAIQPLWTGGQKVLNREQVQRRIKHWSGVIQSATEQSGRTRIPVLQPPAVLADWLGASDENSLRLVLDASATTTAGQLCQASAPESGKITLLVGHEAGFREAEMTDAVAAGFTSVSLGPRVLRSETAAPAMLAMLQVAWGDFA